MASAAADVTSQARQAWECCRSQAAGCARLVAQGQNPFVHTMEVQCLLAAPRPQKVGQPRHLSLPPTPPGAGMAQGRVELCCPSPLGSNRPSLEQQWRTLQGAGRSSQPQSTSMLASILSVGRAPSQGMRSGHPSERSGHINSPSAIRHPKYLAPPSHCRGVTERRVG